MKNKKIAILGSTGSIGTQALQVADFQKDIDIIALSAHSNYKLLAQQANKYKPELVCLTDASKLDNLIELLDYKPQIVSGEDGLIKVAEYKGYDTLLTSVVGNVGFMPTVRAIENGKKILLANKETLVTGGELIMPLAQRHGVDIIPVDSEHCAIFQSLQGNNKKDIKRILLTASGGPFFGKTCEELKNVTKADALAHPNWSMGSKITIDSASLMNKGLEVIEAKWLFGVDINQITVTVHKQSIVHSAIEYVDNSVVAQLGVPDMRLPISYAINYPERAPSLADELDLFKAGTLTFEKPDTKTFKCLDLAYGASNEGGTMPTVMNGANEVAVYKFLNNEIGFLQIADIVEKTMAAHKVKGELSPEKIVEADAWSRQFASNIKL